MGATCNREGCNKKVHSRGMCNTHHRAWWRSTENKPKRQDARTIIKQCMPGTFNEIAKKSGYCYATILEYVNKMHAAREVHIDSWKVPTGISKFQAIYAIGDFQDARLMPKDRKLHRKERNRMNYARRQLERKGSNFELQNLLFAKPAPVP